MSAVAVGTLRGMREGEFDLIAELAELDSEEADSRGAPLLAMTPRELATLLAAIVRDN
jgi:hypothetical protein